jgi:hypothetical protein
MGLITGIAGVLLVPCAIVAGARGGAAVHREEIRKTLTFSAPSGSARRLVVDNINGSINVVGTDRTDITLVALETIRAESEDRIARAREAIRLEITEEPDRILLYINTPWRCENGSLRDDGWDDYGYDAAFDFELRVPVKTDLYLKTVNDGNVSVKNTAGRLRIRNINGGITVSDLAGSGEFSTVNGDVTVGFSENPDSSSSFTTVNGQVEVRFKEDLSADLALKTFNGEMYTDFQVARLPAQSTPLRRQGTMCVYRSDHATLVRVGRGGPALSFDTLNGNIYIIKDQGE